jgi:hypothetical protein
MRETVEIIETAGFKGALKGMRYPTKSGGDSCIDIETGEFILGDKDKRLALGLLNKTEKDWNDEDIFQGDTHGKFQRSIFAWLDVDMPRYIWSELDTYTIGTAPVSSESTMYTLKKELKNIDEINSTMFSSSTPKEVIDGFKDVLDKLLRNTEYEGLIKNIPHEVLKAALPEGWMQKRVRCFSYQTLRRLYLQRKKHRLPEWQVFCNTIEELPYADSLIFGNK